MNKPYNFLLIIFLLLSSLHVNAIIDNRFLPLYNRQYTRYFNKRSSLASNIFFLTGHNAISQDGNEIGIFEINGRYDLVKVAKALALTGKPNPLKTEWQSAVKLDLDLNGKLEGQGGWLGYEQCFADYFYLGFSWYFLQVVNRQKFIITDAVRKELKLSPSSEIEFDRDLRKANNELGVEPGHFKNSGMSDLDMYFRVGNLWEYYYKFRKIDAGLTFGTLFPMAPNLNINNPASIPLGGNGHFGIYFMADTTLELKEDLVVGLWLQFVKRFPKDQIRRMPINGEPLEFGAVTGLARIEPGLTFGISPFFSIEDIRDGLGFKVRYTVVIHDEDHWRDMRKDQTIKTNLVPVIERSSWIAEYFTFSVIYDFGKTVKARKFAPIVYLEWDMPTKAFAAKDFAKTNRVSLGFEFNF